MRLLRLDAVAHEDGQGLQLRLAGVAAADVRHDHVAHQMRVCLLACMRGHSADHEPSSQVNIPIHKNKTNKEVNKEANKQINKLTLNEN